MKILASLVLSIALTGCLDASPNSDPIVYAAKTCEPATPDADRRTFIKHAGLGSNPPKPNLCIDQRSEMTHFRPNSLRIKFYQHDLVGVKLECSDQAAANRFFERHNLKEIALVAGDTIAGLYTSVSPNGTLQCGEMTFTDAERAVQLCEVITKAWSSDPSACLNICSRSQDTGKGGVCVISNAT